jgi:hypothetical protein
MSANTSCENNHQYFCQFYEPKMSMYLVHALTVLVSGANILLSFGIIWFERHRPDNKITLMDKLKMFFCWSTIISTPVIQILNILNYFFGPLPFSACFFLLVFRHILKSNLLFYFNCMAISRYIFIFWAQCYKTFYVCNLQIFVIS